MNADQWKETLGAYQLKQAYSIAFWCEGLLMCSRVLRFCRSGKRALHLSMTRSILFIILYLILVYSHDLITVFHATCFLTPSISVWGLERKTQEDVMMSHSWLNVQGYLIFSSGSCFLPLSHIPSLYQQHLIPARIKIHWPTYPHTLLFPFHAHS